VSESVIICFTFKGFYCQWGRKEEIYVTIKGPHDRRLSAEKYKGYSYFPFSPWQNISFKGNKFKLVCS
jgi:hypothetical protein